jgi:hypothetical protein
MASPQVSASARYPAALPALDLPGSQSAGPFEAYLRSLTDAAAQALAALNRSAAAPAASAAGKGTVLTALVAGAASPGLDAPSPFNPGPAAAALAAAPYAAQSQAASTALPLAQAAGNEDDAQARTAEAATTDASRSSELAADAITAANAAAVASLAATNAFWAAGAASQVASGLSGVATDATAKFMGAGAMGQPVAVLSAYQDIQRAIPAVSGVLAISAMAANTSSNAQDRAFGRTAAPLQTFQVPGEGTELDLNA